MAQNEVNYLRKFDGSEGIIRLYDSLVDEPRQLAWMLLDFAEVVSLSLSLGFYVSNSHEPQNGTLEGLVKSQPDLPLQEGEQSHRSDSDRYFLMLYHSLLFSICPSLRLYAISLIRGQSSASVWLCAAACRLCTPPSRRLPTATSRSLSFSFSLSSLSWCSYLFSYCQLDSTFPHVLLSLNCLTSRNDLPEAGERASTTRRPGGTDGLRLRVDRPRRAEEPQGGPRAAGMVRRDLFRIAHRLFSRSLPPSLPPLLALGTRLGTDPLPRTGALRYPAGYRDR